MTTENAPKSRIIGDRIVKRPRRPPAEPATITTFPIARDQRVARIAAAMTRARSAAAADQSIAKGLRQLTAEMRREGMPAVLVRAQVHALEAQVRGAVWRLTFPWVDDEKKKPRNKVQKPRDHHMPERKLVLPWQGDGQ